MPTTAQDIDALLTVRSENEHLEFKAAANRFDFEELVDYCVAFANERGGRIVLGVTNGTPRRVVGTKAFDDTERTVTGIYERIGIRVTFDEVMHPVGRVLLFHVQSRPRGRPIHHKGRYLMRVGDALVPMSPEELKRICDEGNPEWELKAALTGCDAEGVVQALDTSACFDLLVLPYPATREAVLERFASERLIVREAAGL